MQPNELGWCWGPGLVLWKSEEAVTSFGWGMVWGKEVKRTSGYDFYNDFNP